MNYFKEKLHQFGIVDFSKQIMMEEHEKKTKIEATFNQFDFRPLFTISYDGEKNPGEIGDVVRLQPNYTRLRNRSWQFYLESDLAQTIFRKYAFWVIGSGLKLSSEPMKKFLEEEGITLPERFAASIERRWKLYSNNKLASYNGQKNLHALANEAEINAIVGGDVLVITRIDENNNIRIQIVDGDNVRTPVIGGSVDERDTAKGNRIVHGIVLNEQNEHLAYYVVGKLGKFERIPARDEVGNLRAWMIIGLGYRPDNIRGIPLISAVMETIAKMTRYKEAMVGSAEERAKIVYTIEHEEGSTGETPLSKNLAMSRNLDRNLGSAGTDGIGPTAQETVNLFAKTTNKQAINMPAQSKLKMHNSEIEMGYTDFTMTNATIVCATAQIPVEVAFSKYDSNFSASRAALKDWEHVLKVNRINFSNDYYAPIYSLWMNIQVMTGKISLPSLVNAVLRGNQDINDAIKNARWIGQNVPHIDPLKEVNAERLKLGKLGDNVPLTTANQATEALSSGEYEENAERFKQEIELVEPVDLTKPSTQSPTRTNE